MPEEHPDNTRKMPDDMNIVIWGCTGCLDYGKVFGGNAKNFCGKCGGKLVVRNFTFHLTGE